MSMHTKEEWLVDRQDYTISVERDGEILEIASIGAMDHNGIKYTIGDESWANAYLMRTAPQMLAMLEELVVKALKLNWSDPHSDVLDRAEKVIALAKAGTPSCDDEGEL